MIRVLLMANDSLLADSIASALTAEIDLDVVRLSPRTLNKKDRYPVVIIVEEEASEADPIHFTDLLRDEVTMLVILISLSNRNIHVYESYQLNNPGVERVIELVRAFGGANLKKNLESILKGFSHKNGRHVVI